MPKRGLRQSLSLPDLPQKARHCFEQVADDKSGCAIPLAYPLLSGLVLFGLK